MMINRSMTLILVLVLLAACSPSEAPASPAATLPAQTQAGEQTAVPLEPTEPSETTPPTTAAPATFTETATVSATPTQTLTPTLTNTPLPSASPTISATATAELPMATVLEARAFCRYGPGRAYLYSHELNDGDTLELHGRNDSATWLWVKPPDLDRRCWAATSVMETEADLKALPAVQTSLPKSTLYGPPEEVEATRSGNIVSIVWSPVWMTDDDYRGYLIEASICQNGVRVPVTVNVDGTSYELSDDENCSGSSSGKIYTVEKHGYTDPVEIPWP